MSDVAKRMLGAKQGLESAEYDGGFGPVERIVAGHLHAALQEINTLRYLEEIVVDEIEVQIKILDKDDEAKEKDKIRMGWVIQGFGLNNYPCINHK